LYVYKIQAVSETIHIRYLYDPLCGWCYGAALILAELAAVPGVQLLPQPTGLFSGDGAHRMDAEFAAYAWAHDQRMQRLTGQPFSPEYRQRVLGGRGRFDSHGANVALTAVARADAAAELPALHAIQKARYLEGRDITSPAMLAEVLSECGFPSAAMGASDAELLHATEARVHKGRELLQTHALQGTPALLASRHGHTQPLASDFIFRGAAAVLETLESL
jgi:putative protein-disulfide isomerase